MTLNKLKLYREKTELMKVGMTSSLSKVPDEFLELDNRDIKFKDCVKYLGVKLDQTLSMNNQISSVCHACFLELRRIGMQVLRDILIEKPWQH